VFFLIVDSFFTALSINGVFNILNSNAYIKLAVSCKLVPGTVLLEIHVNTVHLRAIKQTLKKKCPLLHGLDIKLITKCKTVPRHATQAHKASGGITHTLTSAVDAGEWSASRPHRNFNPHHFVVKCNPLNPSVLRCLYLSCGYHRTSSAAPSKYTAPVIIYA
jgi:hypothetical protein